MGDIIILTILLILFVIFFVYKKIWCKSNKLVTSCLLLSILMIGGNDLPIWWEKAAQYYDFIYNLGFGLLSAFIFYWLTVVITEIRKQRYYSFYVLNYVFNCCKLWTHFYLKKKYENLIEINKIKYSNDKNNYLLKELIIDIPYTEIYKILDERKKLTENILETYKDEYWKIEKKRQTSYSENLIISNEFFPEEIQEEKEIRIKRTVIDVYSQEDNFVYKIYKKICGQHFCFKKEMSYYANLSGFEEIEEVKNLLNYMDPYLDGTHENLHYFLRNFKFIEKRIEKVIKKNIEILKEGKKFVPNIRVELNYSNFGIIDEEIIYTFLKNQYSKTKIYYYDLENEIEVEILELFKNQNEYIAKFSDTQKKLKDLDIREISIFTKGIMIH